MRSTLTRFAIAGLTALALTKSASADFMPLLQFFESPPATAVVTATNNGAGTTSITTPVGSIPVTISSVLGVPTSGSAFETFTSPLTSSTAAVNNAGTITQTGYSGTIVFSSAPNGLGTKLLTVTFSSGLLGGIANGNSVALTASQPPGTVTFSSDLALVQAAINNSIARNFAIGFAAVTPPLSITSGSISSFTAQNSGLFSIDTGLIPEPSSIVLAGFSAFAGLGCFGWRRFKASQA